MRNVLGWTYNSNGWSTIVPAAVTILRVEEKKSDDNETEEA